MAAVEAYAAEDLIARSRRLGGEMFARLQAMQESLPVIGDVRGGHGLFAVVELVRDRDTREPLSPWPQSHPALDALAAEGLAAGVSFATRGNLVILAPPLVIGEDELARRARPARRASSQSGSGMSFKLTYSTMFDPPPEMHDAVRAGAGRGDGRRWARSHGAFVDGGDRPLGGSDAHHSPIDRRLVLGSFPVADAADARNAMDAAHRRLRRLAQDAAARSGSRCSGAPRR